ncbi:hypothetical protein Cni_G28207 [Canna indica]|uniref:FLZ-type domain-containing protein n=1 Tax=Canna indica TaxID=4628 RepID=A0AAQ3QQ30_9LILI|nr:hypothetical protein Cni_G28207 [Canna indica]
MLLGKRPRPPMRRTTSMTEFAGDFVLANVDQTHPQNEQENLSSALHHQPNPQRDRHMSAGAADWLEAARYKGSIVPSPRDGRNRRNSGDFSVVETAPFLRACGLCKRRLGPGRDIFMYRGDAFCSLECRQQHMNQDERKDKCSLASIKDTASATTDSEQPGNGETVAAA